MSSSLETLHASGKRAVREGNLQAGLALLQQAALKTAAREEDYCAVLHDLRDASLQLARFRDALSVNWYLGDNSAMQPLLAKVPAVDVARTLVLFSASDDDNAQQLRLQAAELYESLGLLTHAAINRERGADFRAAATLWARLSDMLVSRGEDYYAAGLARFNLSGCASELHERRAARSAVFSAVHLLEEAADRYEQVGQRERAFDCYQVLIAIGKQTGILEHALAGYVNAIRILREDNLRYYALQSYEQALEHVALHDEFSAAATLAKEMADYAAAQHMPSLANHANALQASMWQRVAQAVLARGAPPEVAENALLAAVVSCAKRHQFHAVGKLYEALSNLELERARRVHYARAGKRYLNEPDAEIDSAPLPAHLRNDADYPDVWHVDLIEWEQRGSVAAACADVIVDRQSWTEVTRRRALVARIQALSLENATGPADGEQLVQLIGMLGQVELYSILAPLERLYESPLPNVRLAVVQALERFMYKRTFITIRRALSDAEPVVRQQVYRTIEALRFPHAFDPLARIIRESEDPRARAAAVRAMARIDTQQAAELLLGVFRHHSQDEQLAAVEGLRRARGNTFLEVSRQAWGSLDENARRHIGAVFAARGINL